MTAATILSTTADVDKITDHNGRFMKIRIFSHISFFLAAFLYVVSDLLPYSDLYDPAVQDCDDYAVDNSNSTYNDDGNKYLIDDDYTLGTNITNIDDDDDFTDDLLSNTEYYLDDYFESSTDDWINVYSIVSGLGALFYVVMGVLDLYSVRMEEKKLKEDYDNGVIGHKYAESATAGLPLNIGNNTGKGSFTFIKFACYSMICAGLFGILSSIFVVHGDEISDVFNTISITLYFMYAVGIIYGRFSTNNDHTTSKDRSIIIKWLLIIAYVLLFVGSFMDLILAYTYFITEDNYHTWKKEAISTLVSDSCWLMCSTIYLALSAYHHHINKQEKGK